MFWLFLAIWTFLMLAMTYHVLAAGYHALAGLAATAEDLRALRCTDLQLQWILRFDHFIEVGESVPGYHAALLESLFDVLHGDFQRMRKRSFVTGTLFLAAFHLLYWPLRTKAAIKAGKRDIHVLIGLQLTAHRYSQQLKNQRKGHP